MASCAITFLIGFGFIYECGVAIAAVKILFARGEDGASASKSGDAQGVVESANVQIESAGEELNLMSAASRLS
jgi:hypothetical protein